MVLDVGAQLEIEAHRFLHAVVQHAQPVGRGLFHLRGAEKIAGLDNDLERVAQVVGDPPHFHGEIFGNFLGVWRGLGYEGFSFGHWEMSPSSTSRRLFLSEVSPLVPPGLPSFRVPDRYRGQSSAATPAALTAAAAFVRLKARG